MVSSMRLRALPALILLGCLFCALPVAADDKFVSGVEDLPLMPGLTEVDRGGVVFDKPDGRIVEAVAEGPLAPERVQAFYARTLPQLGWRAEAPGRYVREEERLSIRTEGDARHLTVRFSIAPN